MPGPEFHVTPMGRRFYDRQLPDLIKAIQENTAEVKRANDLKELELKLKGVLQDDEPLQTERDSLHDSGDQV